MQTLIAAIGLPAAIMLSVVVGLIISSTLSALVVLATSLLRRLRHRLVRRSSGIHLRGQAGAARSSVRVQYAVGRQLGHSRRCDPY